MRKRLVSIGLSSCLVASWMSAAAMAQPQGRRPAGRGGNFVERVKAHDKNKDGKITKSEASGRLTQLFDRIDANRDGVIDQGEIKKMAERFARRRPGGGRTRPGAGSGVEKGKPAPDFTLKNVDGKQEVTLSSFAGKKPVALIFGSYT